MPPPTLGPRTLVAIDRRSALPLYRQVRRAIEHGISTGIFVPHHRLPSSRELAAELDISRNVVNLAYQELIAEGFVISHERKGLFVNGALRHTAPVSDTAVRVPDDGIDWEARVNRFADARLPRITKPANWWEYPYPFIAGQVDLRTFPVRAWTRMLRESLYRPHLEHSLQDWGSADDPMLVDMIRKHLLPARGIEATPDQILVTVGSQQGLDLVSRLLLGPGHRVAIEDPGYLDAKHIFARSGADLVGFPVDERGMQLPESLAGISLVYVTPSHHHPTNVTLTRRRRERLLDLAARSSTVVVEDDYDSEFRYSGQPTPALKALDAGGDVIYLGTFSKFLAPGLRVGYLVGPAEFVREVREVRRLQHQARARADPASARVADRVRRLPEDRPASPRRAQQAMGRSRRSGEHAAHLADPSGAGRRQRMDERPTRPRCRSAGTKRRAARRTDRARRCLLPA